MPSTNNDRRFMSRALELAARGRGLVEPNPMVGCVVVQNDEVVGEGWHQRFGGPHAEVEALAAAGAAARGASLFVTLEPCCHQGKTPPCTEAVLAHRVARVVVAEQDPFPPVSGEGLHRLREAGVVVELGLMGSQARELNAPYHKLISTGRPWVIAKWAMTLDGKLASRAGHSQWISNTRARAVVHQLRGAVDAIIVGRQTALNDDPLLTARPAGPRTATRIVCDSQATLPAASQLVRTAHEVPTIVVVGRRPSQEHVVQLEQSGCEILPIDAPSRPERLATLLDELGGRRMTNVLIEGGGTLLGAALDANVIDEVHAFVAPTLLGGAQAVVPFSGVGAESIDEARRLSVSTAEELDGDIYIRGRLSSP